MIARKVKNKIMIGLIGLLAIVSAAPLFAIIASIYVNGARIISPRFLVDFPPPPLGGSDGGIGPALVGTLILMALSILIGGGLGLFTGIFLSEYGHHILSHYTRLSLQIMVEFPTVIIGLFAYAVLVLPLRSFNAFAGAFALAIVIIPYVALQVREAYASIPYSLKEAAYSLGVSPFVVNLRILLSVARRGVATALLVGLARAAGETAPLLFTILGTTLSYFEGLDKPIGAVPLLIYNFALSPYERWHEVAWGAAAVLLTIILALFIVTRSLVKEVKL